MNSLLEKTKEETNDQSVSMGVSAENMMGVFVYSFWEKDAEICDDWVVALSKSKEKYFFICNTKINVEHSAAHLGLRARVLMGN